MGKLWYHRKGKQNAFPVVRIQHALLAVPITDPLRKQLDGLKRSEQARRLKLLREAVDNRKLQLQKNDKQTWERLRRKAHDWLSIFSENDDKRYLALPLMLRRFSAKVVSPEDLLRGLCQLIVQRLEQGHLQDPSLAQRLLVGTFDTKETGRAPRAEVPVVFDVAEPDYPILVGDPKMGSYVGHRLRSYQSRDPDGICALQGVSSPLLKRRFPEPSLGSLGETKLFSKNKDTPCEFRYLKTREEWEDASKSFPVDERIAADIASALCTVTEARLKGKTWRMVANGKWEGTGRNKKEKKDLLLLYCEGQPVISNEAADTFGCDEGEKRAQFVNDSKGLCRALDGIIKHHPQSKLHLLLIGKADKEKKQILMHMTPTPREVLDAAERWEQGVRDNLPTVTVPLPPDKKGDKVVQGQPVPPYPDRVVRLLSSQWVRGGSEDLKLRGPALRQVFEVMLRTPGKWEQTANELLSLTIQRVGPLLLGVAAGLHSGEKEQIEAFKPSARDAALRAVAVLGILLDASESRKETYMKDAPYQIGQVLSLADTLHKDYCVVVRKGEVPNTLVGTSLMRRALDNPVGALADLSERMIEYIRWVKTASPPPPPSVSLGEDDQKKQRHTRRAYYEARDTMEIYKPLAEKLSDCTLPTECNDVMKAQLLLGFLSTPPEKQTEERKEEIL